MEKIHRITIVGAGNMGSALTRGLSGKGMDITVCNPHTDKLDALKAVCPDITVTTDNVGAVVSSDLAILAVKPYVIGKVLDEIKGHIDFRRTMVASLAAPQSLHDIAEALSPEGFGSGAHPCMRLLKVIPNTALSVGESMTFISQHNVPERDMDQITSLFRSMGDVAVIPESLMPAATALCSCGIAYAMRYIRAAVEGAVELGIRPADALRYEIATLRGACALLEASGAHPEAEIDKVTTPGGITIRGLNAMERHGFTAAVIEGLKSSCPS